MLDDFLAAPSEVTPGFTMDVEDAGDNYVISAHLPGVTKDEIDVELNEGRLSISVDKKETEERKTRTTCIRRATSGRLRAAFI